MCNCPFSVLPKQLLIYDLGNWRFTSANSSVFKNKSTSLWQRERIDEEDF